MSWTGDLLNPRERFGYLLRSLWELSTKEVNGVDEKRRDKGMQDKIRHPDTEALRHFHQQRALSSKTMLLCET